MRNILTKLLVVCCLLSWSTSAVYAQKKETFVLIETSAGNIKVKLYNETPLHRDNFIKLVKDKYYDGILFHRVIPKFMIQAGDPDSKNAEPNARLGQGGPGYTVPAEIVPAFTHKKGALCAARQGDQVNPEKASSGSQFYLVQGNTVDPSMLTKLEDRRRIMAKDGAKIFTYTPEQMEVYAEWGGAPHLDGDYTVFGETVEGLEVIDRIAAQATGAGNRPVDDVQIISMKVVRK